MKSSDD